MAVTSKSTDHRMDFEPLPAELQHVKREREPFTPNPETLAAVRTACVNANGIRGREFPTYKEARESGAHPLRYVELIAEELGKATPVLRVIDAAGKVVASEAATTERTVKDEETGNLKTFPAQVGPYRYMIRLANPRERKEEAETPTTASV